MRSSETAREAEFSIGIDLAWSPKNPSGVAVLDREARLVEYLYTRNIDDILALIRRYPDAVVGVDAPLVITNETGHRPHERDFLKVFSRHGLGLHAANTALFEKRFPRYNGFVLYEGLKAGGFGFDKENLFEVYPHATVLACFNGGNVLRYKASAPREERIENLRKLQTKLFETVTVPNRFQTDIFPLKGKALKEKEDFLDALVCAWTLLHCRRSDCLRFGDPVQGILLTPDPSGIDNVNTTG